VNAFVAAKRKEKKRKEEKRREEKRREEKRREEKKRKEKKRKEKKRKEKKRRKLCTKISLSKCSRPMQECIEVSNIRDWKNIPGFSPY